MILVQIVLLMDPPAFLICLPPEKCPNLIHCCTQRHFSGGNEREASAVFSLPHSDFVLPVRGGFILEPSETETTVVSSPCSVNVGPILVSCFKDLGEHFSYRTSFLLFFSFLDLRDDSHAPHKKSVQFILSEKSLSPIALRLK